LPPSLFFPKVKPGSRGNPRTDVFIAINGAHFAAPQFASYKPGARLEFHSLAGYSDRLLGLVGAGFTRPRVGGHSKGVVFTLVRPFFTMPHRTYASRHVLRCGFCVRKLGEARRGRLVVCLGAVSLSFFTTNVGGLGWVILAADRLNRDRCWPASYQAIVWLL